MDFISALSFIILKSFHWPSYFFSWYLWSLYSFFSLQFISWMLCFRMSRRSHSHVLFFLFGCLLNLHVEDESVTFSSKYFYFKTLCLNYSIPTLLLSFPWLFSCNIFWYISFHNAGPLPSSTFLWCLPLLFHSSFFPGAYLGIFSRFRIFFIRSFRSESNRMWSEWISTLEKVFTNVLELRNLRLIIT